MSTKHLSTGSKDVPLQEGKLRVYTMRFCPYAQRVHLVLFAKNIPHDIVYINLKNKPEWFLEKYPLGKVPAIYVNGTYLSESLVISDFLDEMYTKPPLYPSDPVKKAKDRLLVEGFNKIINLLYKCYLSPTMDYQLIRPVFDEMDTYERELASRKTPFFSGSTPGMVDYMIWPWCERLEMIRILGGEQFKVPKDRFSRLWEWSKAMLEEEAVKKWYITPEQHAKYFQSHKAGSPDYDNIL